MARPVVLYGMQASLYSAKARSYLRKQRIDFEERSPGHAEFNLRVVPAVHRWIIPVLQTADGRLVQDSADIIDHFESSGSVHLSAYPGSPLLRTIAHIFELFGGEGLLRPAMHYRWHFDDDNLAFLSADLAAGLAPPGADAPTRQSAFAMISSRMRKAAASVGATPATAAAIEGSYREFLAGFDAHLQAMPYLLGGRPCIGDYGLIGPLFAHLARDPHPAQLMKRQAPRVWRWVERMNTAEADAGEYGNPDQQWLSNDSLPATLETLLCFVADDYLPELRAHVRYCNEWLAQHSDLAIGSNGLKKPGDRSLGMAGFHWRGIPIETAVMPYRFYLLQRIQSAAASASANQRTTIEHLLQRTGLSELLTLTTLRPIERHDHVEVWGVRADQGI